MRIDDAAAPLRGGRAMTGRDALLALLDARTRSLARGVDVVHQGDALAVLRAMPSESVHTIITSPPYYQQRRYLPDDHPDKALEIGLDETPEAYVARLVTVFEEARRVLRSDGVMFVNMGDSYWNSTFIRDKSAGAFLNQGDVGYDAYYAKNGGGVAGGKRRSTKHPTLKEKDLIMMPARLAIALQDAGWWLRSDIIWNKVNPMPESVTDRPTKAHEYVFLLAKSADYFYDADAIREGALNTGGSRGEFRGGGSYTNNHSFDNGAGRLESKDIGRQHIPVAYRNKRTVWSVPSEPSSLPHFAAFPQALIEPMILAGCPAQVCATCGAGYVRVVESEPMKIRRTDWGARAGNRTASSGTMVEPAKRQTLGFAPTCSCPQDTPPGAGIVLDPFMGTGTTALVALRHGRHYIGIELNEEYAQLARDRIAYAGDDKRLLAERAAHVAQLALPGVGG